MQEVSFDRLTADDVQADLDPLQNVRLLNPSEMLSRFRIDRGVEAGLSIDDLDVDRYVLDGERQQVLIAARELDLDGSPNQSWQGRHLINTRGCGLVMAPVGRVLESDRPDYQTVEGIERQELYFSPSLTGYAVAGTSESERPCNEAPAYSGTAGVQMSSFVRRAAFALAFLDYNVLGSGAIESDSQMLWVRNVRDRLSKLAPFLSYDGDPYPVVVDGRVKWVVDAYTTTNRYPYGQRVGNEVQLTPDSGLVARRQLRAQQRQGRRRRLRRDGHVLRQRSRGSDHPGMAGRVRRSVLAVRGHARRRCASTCATRRTCSGCRPTPTRSTSWSPTSSSSVTVRGRWPRRRRSIHGARR